MADEVKPLVDLTLIRKDILAFIARMNEVQQVYIQKYLMDNPSDSIDFIDIAKRVEIGNRQYLLDRKEPDVQISYEEILYLARLERHVTELIVEQIPELQVSTDVNIEPTMINSIPAEWQRTPSVSDQSIIIYLHGGGFMTCSPKTHRRLSSEIGRVASTTVLSIDYRLAPEHPYPAAPDDVFDVYNGVIDEGYDPSKIVIAGDSAGGCLTLMTLLRIRNEGLQLPAAGVCMAPATDLTATHETIFDNVKTDISLAPAGVYWLLKYFLGSANPKDGTVSPLFADLEGLPPLLFQASKIEMLYSDSIRFVEKAKAAGVEAVLQSWDDTVHIFQWYNLPEAKDAIDKIGAFVRNKMS